MRYRKWLLTVHVRRSGKSNCDNCDNCDTVMLSNALVIPRFDYGCTVWSSCSSELQNKVQILHNNLARIILSADIRTPVNDMMDALQWVKLEKRWHEQPLLIVFKCLKNMGPSYLSSQFKIVYDYHSYKTRNHTTNTLIVPKFKGGLHVTFV